MAVIIILYLTGWYKPLAIGVQQALLSTGLIKPSIELNSEMVTQKTDYLWNLKTMEDEIISLEAFRGKVIFLNYFATWCPPCVAEMPGIQALYEDLQDNPNIVFVIISRDDSMEKVTAFMEKKGYSLPVYSAASRTPEILHTNVLPTTYIIAPNGSIVSTHEGMADYDNDKVRTSLESLAKSAYTALH